MSDISTLKQAQAAAFAAWQACPTSKKAEKARLAAELDSATKAVAAAKRAAAPVEPVSNVAALVAAHNARAAEREADEDLIRRVRRAARMYAQALHMPRAQAWPCNSTERAADALLREHRAIADSLFGEGWEE